MGYILYRKRNMKRKCGFSHRWCSTLWMQINQHMHSKNDGSRSLHLSLLKMHCLFNILSFKRDWTCNKWTSTEDTLVYKKGSLSEEHLHFWLWLINQSEYERFCCFHRTKYEVPFLPGKKENLHIISLMVKHCVLPNSINFLLGYPNSNEKGTFWLSVELTYNEKENTRVQ